MPKKGLSYNSPPSKPHRPADLARFPEIQAAINVDHRKRMADIASGRMLAERARARAGHKYRNKGIKRRKESKG